MRTYHDEEKVSTPGGEPRAWYPLEARPHTGRRALWRAVLRYARVEWRRETGRRWDESATFKDRELPEHELRAIAVAAQLREALLAVAEFASDYQRRSVDQTVIGPTGSELRPKETYETRKLLQFVEDRLPELDRRVEDGDGRKIAVSRWESSFCDEEGFFKRHPSLTRAQLGGWALTESFLSARTRLFRLSAT